MNSPGHENQNAITSQQAKAIQARSCTSVLGLALSGTPPWAKTQIIALYTMLSISVWHQFHNMITLVICKPVCFFEKPENNLICPATTDTDAGGLKQSI